MNTILFVHGTGVRESDYTNTYNFIEKKIQQFLSEWQLEKCFWGEQCGAKFHKNGDSIPNYPGVRAIGDRINEEDESLILWQLLYSDPCFELFLVSLTSEEEQQMPNFDRSIQSADGECEKLLNDIIQFSPSSTLQEFIGTMDYFKFWQEALNEIIESDVFTKAILCAEITRSEKISIFARAVTAQLIILASEKGMPVLDGYVRDALVNKIIQALDGDSRSMLGVAASHVSCLIDRVAVKSVSCGLGAGYFLSRRMATYAIQRQRGVLSDKITPATGDILLYQTRGKEIRDFIRQRIEALPGKVILLAHSLGGIACVDLLIEKPLDNVIGLITVGTQAPFLYEIDSLTMLRHFESLPANFPDWINLYDPHDFLSYKGDKVFANRVEDVEIQSNQPFPKSHSAYWSIEKTWEHIAEFADKCLN